MTQFIGNIGKTVVDTTTFYMGLLSLLYHSGVRVLNPATRGRRFIYSISIAQIYFTGVQAAGLISLIGLVLGLGVVAGLGSVDAAKQYIGMALVLVLVKYLGPLLAAIVVIARSGTAMATEIANMVLRNEMLALESMAVDTLTYVVAPRLIGMSLSILCLNFIFTTVGVVGGAVAGALLYSDVTFAGIYHQFFETLLLMDIVVSITKAVFYGFGISLICMINGFKVQTFPGGTPVAGIRGVVGSIQYLFVITVVIEVIFGVHWFR